MAKKKDDGQRVVADNRKARHLYFIESTVEAGLVLMGSEVKSLRTGKANIAESYAQAKDGEILLSIPISPNTRWPTASITSRAGCANFWCTKSEARRSPRPFSAKA